MKGDKLVTLIFDAIRNEQAEPGDKVTALIRAGLIAQAYNGECREILERVFGSGANTLKDNSNLNLSGGRTANTTAH